MTRVLDLCEVAAALRVSARTARRHATGRYRLVFLRDGSRLVSTPELLDRYVASLRPPAPEPEEEVRKKLNRLFDLNARRRGIESTTKGTGGRGGALRQENGLGR